MKQIIKLMLIVFVCLMVTEGYAQKVVVESGKYIIDASGIPHDTNPKSRETDGTDHTPGSNSRDNIGSSISNEKVYRKFEVSSTDGPLLTWSGAVDFCKNLTTDGGGWRIPTLREVLLIWVLMPDLKSHNFPAPNSRDLYWTATEWKDGYVYYADLRGWLDSSSTTTDQSTKLVNRSVRCIRDIK